MLSSVSAPALRLPVSRSERKLLLRPALSRSTPAVHPKSLRRSLMPSPIVSLVGLRELSPHDRNSSRQCLSPQRARLARCELKFLFSKHCKIGDIDDRQRSGMGARLEPGQARRSVRTRAGWPSISEASPLGRLNVSVWGSSPKRCSRVAWRSEGVTTFSTALRPISSVLP